MDDDVKAILGDLYRAINARLERSRAIDESVRRLQELGYQPSMYLEATILLETEDDRPAAGSSRRTKRRKRRLGSGELRLDASDEAFLRSMKIAIGRRQTGTRPADRGSKKP